MIAKSAQRSIKIRRVKTWKARPATIMLSPMLGGLFWCVSEDAIPPPAACNSSDIKSQGMNYPTNR